MKKPCPAPIEAPPAGIGEVEPLGPTFPELAKLYALSRSTLYARKDNGSLAVVQVSPGRFMVLHGDHEVLGGNPPDPEHNGLRTIDNAVPGRFALRIPEVATSITCTPRTVERMVHRGELPATKEAGVWLVKAEDFRRWLRSRRVPARWEGGR